MNLRALWARWDAFLFAPVPVTPVAVCRIMFGVIVLAWALQAGAALETFYGPAAVLSEETIRGQEVGASLNVFDWLPGGAAWVWPVFWLLVVSALCVTIGLGTRVSCAIVFVLLCSFDGRNPAVHNAGDRLLRILAFLLTFSAAGKALSVDRLIRIARGRERADRPVLHAPWAQRLIQLDLSLLYLMTYAWKITAPVWRDGTALFLTTRLEDFYRFNIPVLFDYLITIKLLTWSVLAIEFALGVLIWFRPLRYYVLAAGVALHLGIELTMNIPIFQWVNLAMMTTFVGPEVYARGPEMLRRLTARAGRQPRTVVSPF